MGDRPLCPTPEMLRLLLAEPAPADTPSSLLAHVGDCPDCQRTLESLAGADPALITAARDLQRTSFQAEVPLRRVIDGLCAGDSVTRLDPDSSRLGWVQSLLRPAGWLEALGQLEGYEIAGLLGQGGMGLVLKAFDPGLKRWVAIKALAPDLARDPLARQRFEREGQAAAAVRHEHVVTVHTVDEAGGVPFLVMEYVPGGSLQDYLDLHGPPGWPVAARIGAEVAAGLSAAHARGLVHRDIKPSNILLQASDGADGPGAAKISDFGLARAADESRLTGTGVVAGTPMYMAPEQALCRPVDHRADLFSLGSLLYVLCTGREPFQPGTPLAVLKQVAEAMPAPVRSVNPDVPPWLSAVVERLHAKLPQDRFASAAEVAELLRHNLAHPDRPRRVSLQRPRRRRLLAALAVGVLLAGGLALSESLHWTRLTGWGAPRQGPLPLRATLQGHAGPVWSVAFAPDGRTLATGGDDATLRFWDAATGRQVGTEKKVHGSPVLSVAFAHPGGVLVTGGGDNVVRFWDVAARRELPGALHLSGSARRIALSPDGKTAATGSGTQDIELWDLRTRALRQTLPGHQGSILAIAFSPDGATLAAGDAGGHVRFWDLSTGAERPGFRGDTLGLRALAFAPDGRLLATAGTGDRDVKLWEPAAGRLVATLAGYPNSAQSLAFSPDGRRLSTGSRDGVVKLWDVDPPRLLASLDAHQGYVWSTAFSTDGRTLATVGEDGVGKLWDLTDLAGDGAGQ